MRGEVPGLGFFATPMGARPATGVRDEMGNPVYLDAGGNQFTVQQQPAPPESEWSWAGVGNALAMPWRMATGSGTPQDTATAQGIGNALAQGFTAPGRAARGEPVTHGDAWSTALDYGVMGAPMAAPEGALRAGGMRTAADDVADLLSQGRAAEVTDEMMARVDPQEIWKLYESGETGMSMLMDEASRMARAREIGFGNTPLFRGESNPNMNSFETGAGAREGIGVTTSTSPNVAATYMSRENPSMYPLVSRSENALLVDVDGRNWTGIPADARANDGSLSELLDPQAYLDEENYYDFVNNVSADWGDGTFQPLAVSDTNSVAREAQANGYDEVRFNNVVDRGGSGQFHTGPANDPHTTVMTAIPSNIRSRFARFDPRLSHLRNLSASLGGVAMMNALASGENQ